jgi:hypothetical protein
MTHNDSGCGYASPGRPFGSPQAALRQPNPVGGRSCQPAESVSPSQANPYGRLSLRT